MNERDESQDTQVDPPPPVSEFTELAQLAFASRHLATEQSLAARNLVYLSPDALDMDLSDPMQRDFGDYELLEKIGQGGMGVVYRAHQRSLDREVALKLLIAGPWAPQKFIERFQLEAQSAARLEHPNIVTVYEGGSQQDLHYFSMRLVRGEALSAVLRRRGRLDSREAAQILLTTAEAVDYAHRLGVLHLDLKPGNILMDASGEPLVADFGLARRLDQALADPAGDASGTPSYMAPEQADAKTHPIGVATDIYGLGCILYEMLCTQPPFSAPTAHATLQRVLSDRVQSPRAHNTAIPRDLEAICLKCLSKNPAERYQSAGDLIEDLRAFLDDRPVSVRRPPPSERMRRWVRREPRFAAAVAGVAGALIIGLATTSQQWQRAEANALEARQLVWQGRREAAIELEADGRGLEAWEALLTNLEEQEDAGELEQAALERLRIGLLRSQGARFIDTMLVADSNPIATSISPDSSLLAVAFASDLTLRWYDTDNLEERGRVSFRSVVAPEGDNADWRTSDGARRAPQLLRFIDNDRLLVTFEWYENRVNPSESDTWLVDLGNGRIVEPPDGFTVAAYSRNGEWALLADAGGGIELWQAIPSWLHVSTLGDVGARTLAWMVTEDGRAAFSLGIGMRGLTKRDVHGGTPAERITVPGGAGISAWMLSGDGRQLALGDFEGNVFLLDVASLALRKLPFQRGREISWMAFSEDDAWLAMAETDGLVQVIDLTADDLAVASDMRAEFPVRHVEISRRERLLIAAGEGQAALWRIPREDVRARPAHRIGVAPAAHAVAGIYAVGWSLESGLLASAGADGRVRLWRLPPPPSLRASAARQVTDELHESVDQVIDTEWNNIRLVSPEGRPLTDWLELEQPPGYAVVLDEGRILLVTVGASIRTYATSSLKPRYAPIPLPATPQRLLTSPDGRFVLLSFGTHDGFGLEEQLRALDAVTGTWLRGEAGLFGPIQHYALSPDGQTIAALGPAEGGVTTLLRRDGLEVISEYTHYYDEPIVSLDFKDDKVLLLTRPAAPGRRASVLSWDPRTNQETRLELDEGVTSRGVVLATDSGFAVFSQEYDLLFDDTGASRQLRRHPSVADDRPARAALSQDGRILARGYDNAVQLYDMPSGEPIGLPLATDIRTLDNLSQVTFAGQGRELRTQSLFHVQYRWPIAAETASTDEQRSELAQLADSGDGTPIHPPSSQERRRLRAADPGAWRPDEVRPPIAVAPDSPAGLAIPARLAGTTPWLVDLSAFYNRSPFSFSNTFEGSLSSMVRFPAGVWQLENADFDVRGFVQLGLIEHANNDVFDRLDCIPLPAIPATAIHLLVHNGLERRAPVGETLAEVTLHYEGGGEARIPLRAGYELEGAEDDDLVPFAFATEYALSITADGLFPALTTPRIENPDPERLIRCIDLWRPGTYGATLELYGITLEPIDEDVAVIAAEESVSID